MRHKETVAVTITLPKALFDAASNLADQRECGNVSAVVRAGLYKEIALSPSVALNENATAQIKQAEARTVKYSVRKKKKPDGGSQASSKSIAATLFAKAVEAVDACGAGEPSGSKAKRQRGASRAAKTK